MKCYVIAEINSNGAIFFHRGGNVFGNSKEKGAMRIYSDLRTANIQYDKIKQNNPEKVLLMLEYEMTNRTILK